MSVVVRPDRPLFSSYAVFHRAQCLSCTQLTCFHSFSCTACRRTCTLTTLRSMVQVVHLISVPCRRRLPRCLTAAADWMSANRLQLYSDKTEFMWLTSPRSQHRLPTSGSLIGSKVVSPSATVRDLGVFIDQDLTMKTHVQQTASIAALPPCVSCIRRCIPTSVFNSLISALVLTPQQVGLFMGVRI